MATISTKVEWISVRATLAADEWVAVIMPDVPATDRPFDLRCTYVSEDAATALGAAMHDVLTWLGWRGHGLNTEIGAFLSYLAM